MSVKGVLHRVSAEALLLIITTSRGSVWSLSPQLPQRSLPQSPVHGKT